MKRIAILGGGIAGVSAAYELALQQQAGAQVEFVLFEATHRLGGIVETQCRDGFVIECGPDSWVSEKSAARELAIELGLESEIIFSQDERRKTYIAKGRTLQAMPDGMRMMVPVQWTGVLNSPLFSWQAKLAYLREPKLAEELKVSALDAANPREGRRPDESVRDFVLRHFGPEVTDTIAAPLLTGVFGGDIATLSTRATLPAFVALEREHGSLILGLQQRVQAVTSATPIFTTLRNGLSELIEGMVSHIPAKSIRCGTRIEVIERMGNGWRVCATLDVASRQQISGPSDPPDQFDAVVIATPATATMPLLAPLDLSMADLLPQHSSSAIIVAFGFTAEQAQSLRIPRGFGFLVPQRDDTGHTLRKTENKNPSDDLETSAQRALLACTFVDQKFPHRAPLGAVLLRAFFGGQNVSRLLHQDDATLLTLARTRLGCVLGRLPEPTIALVRRLPNSLPLYLVGHLERIAELESRVAQFPHLRLIGSAYRGVGLPDLILAGRKAARETIAGLVTDKTS